MDSQKILNKGIITFRGKDDDDDRECDSDECYDEWCKSRYHCRFNKGQNIFLCDNVVQIPELDISCRISWVGSSEGFRLLKSSSDLLKAKGVKFIRIRGINGGNKIMQVDGKCWFEDIGLVFVTCTYYYLVDGSEEEYSDYYHCVENKKVKFTLLDKFRRDFESNPVHDKHFDISSDKLEKKFMLDFDDLLHNDTLSDLTLQCKDGTLSAHKIILISRSVFFKRMFSHDLVESTSKEVRCDFKVEIMQGILKYIYRNTFDRANAYDLYEAADYYGLIELKLMCEKTLVQEMTLNNMFSVIRLADTFNSSDFKRRALSWISWNNAIVKKSEEYSELKSSEDDESAQFLLMVDTALEVTANKSAKH